MDKEDIYPLGMEWNTTEPLKKNEILPVVTTWMDLEGIMLTEISQTKTNTIFLLICGI